MHRKLALMLLAVAMFVALPYSAAQSNLLDLPRDSQRATLVQRVGITDIKLVYHRPLVNGRPIWGKLVPYGEVWRAGANENTTIQFTDPVSIEGQSLDKGTYGVHMIPGENEWTVIFSKSSTAWGSFTYNEADDALRVKVKPQATDMHEALTYDFDSVTADSTVLTLRWEKVAVPVKVGVNTKEIVQASLHKQLQGLAQYAWDGWDDAATYLVTNKVGLEDALRYEDMSIKTERRYENLMNKSKILEAMGRKDEAEAAKTAALERANGLQLYVYGRGLQRDGKQDQAFEYFRQAAKKDPGEWITHLGTARIYSAKGDFDNAAREMKLCVDGAPDNQKIFFKPLLAKLEAKQDINKN